MRFYIIHYKNQLTIIALLLIFIYNTLKDKNLFALAIILII